MFRSLRIAFLIGLITGVAPISAQPPAGASGRGRGGAGASGGGRAAVPTRDPHTAGYVMAKDLPDGDNAPANADGNFILGPTHNAAREMSAQDNVPRGTIYNFTMQS